MIYGMKEIRVEIMLWYDGGLRISVINAQSRSMNIKGSTLKG